MEVDNQLAAAPDAGGDGSAASPDTTQVENSDGAASGSEGQSQAPAHVSYEMENEARSMGWVPQNEWRGDPNNWRPADDFVKRGKEVLPIVRSQLDRERRKVQELETRIKDLPASIETAIEGRYADRFKRLEKMSTVALQKQADQIYRQFEARKRAAVEAADPAAYDRAADEQRQALADLQADFDAHETREVQQPQQRQQEPQKQAPPSEVTDWIDRNSTWFDKDPVLTAVASAEHGRLRKEFPAMSLDQNLKRVDEFLRQRFPDKFGIDAAQQQSQQRAHSPQVEGGTRQPAGTGRARGWNDLPPEAVKAGQRFIDQGLYGEDPKKARDEYAKDYWSQE